MYYVLRDDQQLADPERLREERAKCQKAMQDYEPSQQLQGGDGPAPAQADCPIVWDSVRCWPTTPAGQTAWMPCPEYIHGFNHTAQASRQCSSLGTWVDPPDTNVSLLTWTHSNYSQCPSELRVPTILDMWVPVVKKVGQMGYSVSLFTLIVAFVVLISIKKLRCPRNNLHLHLFASFMLRAAMYLLKDVLFVRGVGLPSDVKEDVDGRIIFLPGRSNWECKLIISLWQYSIMANYSWILMEGLYLHNLIFLALFSDNSAITLYVCLGWGIPLSVVLPWIIGRRYLDDNYCWTVNDHDTPYYLVRIPTIITVTVSFFLFVNIARVLLVKMQASVQVQRRGMRYKRWARSTMVLVPLFGTHYALFLVFSVGISHHEVIEVVWLLLDQTFASFQGCLVALLYCLLTREVRGEVRRRWQSTRAMMWGVERSGSSRRPGSLLQSAPETRLSRPGPPCGAPCGGYHRPDELPCQISGRLELDRLPDDVIESGMLDDSKNKDVEVHSMAGLGLTVALGAAARNKNHDAQSWV